MRRTALLAATVALVAFPATVDAEVPMYTAEFAGPSTSATMNEAGIVIGNDSQIYPGRPWVNDGTGPRDLPLPPGTTAARVGDINDSGVIVGTGYADGSLLTDLPARWTPDGAGGYDVELLPLPGGATRGTGVAINNHGQIIASGFLIGGVLPTYQSYVIDGEDVVPLGISGASTINDNGLILTGTTVFDYPTMTDLGPPPLPDGMSAIAVYPADLNDNNQVLVTILRTIISYTRYEVIGIYDLDLGSWSTLTGVGYNFSAVGMNDHGDFLATGGSCSVMVYFQGLGYYCPGSLLDPADTTSTVGAAMYVANDRSLLAAGTAAPNTAYGTVLLRPAGNLPVPAPPVDVVATPHEPTAQQNFVSIDLSWAPADALTRSYVVERRGPGDADFVAVTSTTNRFYRDMDLVGGGTYAYRVLAVGLAGESAPSAVVGAVAPFPGDTEAPLITSISLQNGDVVSGVVTIEVTAIDNVGVRLIAVQAPGMKQRCDTYDSTAAACRWDTRDLAAGPASIYVTASDAMGNGTYATVTVEVEPTSGKGGGKGGGGGGGGGGNGKGPKR